MSKTLQQETYLTARQVRQRYGGASSTWIKRRLANDSFPVPVYLAGSRFWRIIDLIAWDAAQVAAPKREHIRDMAAVRAARGRGTACPVVV